MGDVRRVVLVNIALIEERNVNLSNLSKIVTTITSSAATTHDAGCFNGFEMLKIRDNHDFLLLNKEDLRLVLCFSQPFRLLITI